MKGFKFAFGFVVFAILGSLFASNADAGIFFGHGKAAARVAARQQFRQQLRQQQRQHNLQQLRHHR